MSRTKNPTFNIPNLTGNWERARNTYVARRLFPSKLSSLYVRSGLGGFLSFSNALRFYPIKTKPDIQLWKEIKRGK